MSEFDPMDTSGQVDAGTVYSDDVDTYASETETVASYADTTSYEDSASGVTEIEDTTGYQDTTYEAEPYDTASASTETTVGSTEMGGFQPYANSDNPVLSVDALVTSPAPATTAPAEVSNFQPYANSDNPVLSVDALVTFTAPEATATTAYDPATTADIDDWQTAYDDWNASVATTGQDPLAADVMVGEPYEDAGFWFKQNTQFTCGPSVATQIISDFTGNVQLSETELMNEVTANNWWVRNADSDPDIDGMDPRNIATLLTNHGVPSVYEEGKDIDDLVQYLSEGKAVVLALDNENLPGATGEQDGPEGNALLGPNTNPNDDANHVVRLVGIDTERGIAYLSDPGRADGKNLAVPLETLKEAWNDSKNAVIVSLDTDPTPDETAAPATTQPGETETPETNPAETAPATTAEAPQADRDPAPAPTQAAAPPARPAASQASDGPSVVRTETVTTSMTPPADVAPLDLGVSDQINDMLQTAADAATPPVDLTTPSSQPDGLFDSALGFVLIPVAVSAGVAGTLGYRQLRSNR